MQVRKQLPQSVLAAVVAVVVAAPVAGAVPMYDGHPPHRATSEAYDVNRETGAYIPAAPPADMHASTVAPPALDTEIVAGDLRTEAAKSPIESPLVVKDELPAGGDLRSEAAKGPDTPTPPVGMPTWPVDPKPIVPAGPEPVAATDGDGGSFDWPLAGLIAGGAIALLGAALIGGRQVLGHTRPAH